MLRVQCEKDYEQGTCLHYNFNFRHKIEFLYCCVLFSMVILRKGDSAKTSSHYFALFLHSAKLVIFAFISHNLTTIYVLYAWIILNLLTLYVIACYDRSNM